MSVKTLEIELQKMFDTQSLEEELENIEIVLPEIKHTYNQEAREELPEMLGNTQKQEMLVMKYELLQTLFNAGDTIEDIASKVDEILMAEKERYEENMQVVYEQIKPFEKTVRSLALLYRNANPDANVYIIPVNATRFADSTNPKHFNEFSHYLRQKFYEWEMEDSPFYITYVGNIGSKTAMEEMAKIAEETRALSVVDIKELKSAKDAVDYAKSIKITGIPANLAHQVTMGTWLIAEGAFDVEFFRDAKGSLKRMESPMAIPAASAFIGKMMSVPAGYFISGLEQSPIIGIKGVKVAYDLQRIDAKKWEECGLIQITGTGKIMGSTTANKSNNPDLTEFTKVDVTNSLLKDLVQYCNNKAYSKWGEDQKREFTREIEDYLNIRQSQEVFEQYEINSINYDKLQKVVNINITICFFDVANEFDINLHGPKGMIDFKKPEKAASK